MLAAADLAAADSAAVNAVDAALSFGSAQVEVELLPYNEVLRITGNGSGNLTIDLSQLPDSIVNLQISSFQSVTLIGEQKVNSLTLTSIKKVDAGRISIGSTLAAYNVEHVRIDQAPNTILLQGAHGFGSVGEKTLLEVGKFSSSPTAFIFAWVQNLGLATTSHVENLPQIASFPTQTLLMNFQPEKPVSVSTQGPVQVITGGDFTKYFLATPTERAALEQSHVVARLSINANVVTLASLLNNPAMRAVLSEWSEGNAAANAFRGIRVPEFGGFDSRTLTNVVNAADSIARGGDASGFFGSASAPVVSAADRAVAVSVSDSSSRENEFAARADWQTGVDGQLRFDNIDAEADAASRSGESPVAAFDRMITGLREQLTTFGERITQEVSDHFRSDRQLALLGEARGSRPREDAEFDVLKI